MTAGVVLPAENHEINSAAVGDAAAVGHQQRAVAELPNRQAGSVLPERAETDNFRRAVRTQQIANDAHGVFHPPAIEHLHQSSAGIRKSERGRSAPQ